MDIFRATKGVPKIKVVPRVVEIEPGGMFYSGPNDEKGELRRVTGFNKMDGTFEGIQMSQTPGKERR